MEIERGTQEVQKRQQMAEDRVEAEKRKGPRGRAGAEAEKVRKEMEERLRELR